jgi:RNA polymerase sigma-70 factor (ECF subfamily)
VSIDNDAPAGDFAQLADPYRRELLAHCYRMLGSLQDAEDLVQETLLRAWRGYDAFDGRSSLRTWLYRIATNACLSALKNSNRRVLPSGLGAPTTDSASATLDRLDTLGWLEPIPTRSVLGPLVLILVDVVGFSSSESAQFLDITLAAARSLLQRARATLARDLPTQDRVVPDADLDSELLRRYLHAFETADTAALAQLLRSDVEYEMPPIPTWYLGRHAVLDHHTRRVFGTPRRAITTSANGYPALATYLQIADGTFEAHGVQVIESREGLITRIAVFLNPHLFPKFGLPTSLPAAVTS